MTTHLQRLSLLVLMGVVACIHATWCHAAGTATSQDDVLWQMAVREQAELEQSRVHLEDAVLGEYVRTLVMRLWKEAQSDLVPMQVRVLVDSTANASVYPNGVCYLTSGMLAVTQNQDQLAMILAHEMIHYIRRHSLAVHSRFSGSATPSIGRDMSEARLVQAAEKQADVEGVALMRKAGFCAGEAVAVISRSLASIPLRNPSQPVEASSRRCCGSAHPMGSGRFGKQRSGSRLQLGRFRWCGLFPPDCGGLAGRCPFGRATGTVERGRRGYRTVPHSPAHGSACALSVR